MRALDQCNPRPLRRLADGHHILTETFQPSFSKPASCIHSAILSTEAFGGIEGRPVVTNIFGTAHAYDPSSILSRLTGWFWVYRPRFRSGVTLGAFICPCQQDLRISFQDISDGPHRVMLCYQVIGVWQSFKNMAEVRSSAVRAAWPWITLDTVLYTFRILYTTKVSAALIESGWLNIIFKLNSWQWGWKASCVWRSNRFREWLYWRGGLCPGTLWCQREV